MRRNPRSRLFALSVLFLMVFLYPLTKASGSTVIPLTLEEMDRLASDVVLGTVESTKAGWDKEHRLIETRVRLRIEKRFKGKGGKTAIVVVAGGVVGEVGMRQVGAAVFSPGERVLLFAEPKGRDDLRPVGLFQGKLRVKHDSARGMDMVQAPGPAWGAKGEPIPSGTIPDRPSPALPLDVVLKRLGISP